MFEESLWIETEGLIMAAQEEALCTSDWPQNLQKGVPSVQKLEEMVDHLFSCCKKIVQSDYKERHDKVAKMIYWNIWKYYILDVNQNWCYHQIENN